MTLLVISVVSLSVFVSVSLADFDPRGVKCGELRCNITEYCSPFDQHCRPCAVVCDVNSHNYQPEECAKDCQVYLQDQRYMHRMDPQYYDLKEEVERLKIRFTIITTLICILLLGMFYLLGRTLIQWEKIQNTLRALFTRKLVKAANKNKVQDDVEANVNKQNGLKLSIPSISATVESESKSSENSKGNNSSPNTTSTTLSRRCASEDKTLDFSYDNPAMTPSPEAAQMRIKARESSF
ncbi:protein grindelwald isoform X2 [Pseudomyrmex gracilis]|uniref:protein grindelwald isoform X2 n=1 Tax=Pseudomyrmex gracilis TaxID=219809 RepID=UPI000995198E|nr:protein grindelwald isoform X2 [Pseudomyrmex gracilis]